MDLYMNDNATYRTHYANHDDERCEVLDRISESTLLVLFDDGAVNYITASNIVLDAGVEI